jgi:hypothetical protein
MQLAFRVGNDVRIIGWGHLGQILGIDTKKRTTIHFNYDGKQQIQWWFAAIEIKCNQDAQAYMIWKKVNKNSEIKNSLMTALIARGFDVARSNDPEYFSGQLFKLAIEDFQTGTEVHDILVRIRADVNRGCEKIAQAWEMSPQLVCYWKKRMAAQQIIGRGKLAITSRWSVDTAECHKNPFCHVIWNAKLKERVWILCDQLTLIMPWKWQEFLKKNGVENDFSTF